MTTRSTVPIQVTDEGVYIPRRYLREGEEFEVLVSDEYVLVRPKTNGDKAKEKSWLEPLIGIAETTDPTASERVEEILAAEIL